MQGYLEEMRWCKIPQRCMYSFILLADFTLASLTRSLSAVLCCLPPLTAHQSASPGVVRRMSAGLCEV